MFGVECVGDEEGSVGCFMGRCCAILMRLEVV